MMKLPTHIPLYARVPQGSILGPFLYSLYTPDLPIGTFADDTAFMASDEDPKTANHILQEHILIEFHFSKHFITCIMYIIFK